jgi:hypothetical protein
MTRAGDRLRGAKFAMKAAYSSNRLVLLSDVKPVPLQSILAPNELNWVTDGLEIGSQKDLFWYEQFDNATATNYAELMDDTQFIFLHTNFAADTPYNPSAEAAGLKLVDPKLVDGAMNKGGQHTREELLGNSCMMRSLFKASPALQADHAKLVLELFNATAVDVVPHYTAIHFRMGGMGKGLGEHGAIRRTSLHHLHAFVNGLACARQAAEAHNITAPIVVLTDNTALRASITAGYFGAHVVTTGERAVHLDWLPRVGEEDQNRADWVAEEARRIYADLMVLTGARCVVAASKSGFNNLARGWAAMECFMGWNHECLKMPLHNSLQSMFNLPLEW